MEPYCGQNYEKFIDELEGVSGDSGSKNPAVVTRIGFSPTDRSLLLAKLVHENRFSIPSRTQDDNLQPDNIMILSDIALLAQNEPE
jgi:hypothetical protein